MKDLEREVQDQSETTTIKISELSVQNLEQNQPANGTFQHEEPTTGPYP